MLMHLIVSAEAKVSQGRCGFAWQQDLTGDVGCRAFSLRIVLPWQGEGPIDLEGVRPRGEVLDDGGFRRSARRALEAARAVGEGVRHGGPGPAPIHLAPP